MTQAKKKTPTWLSWLDDNNEAQSLYFDLVLQDEPVHSSEVTKYPVEQGANVADHVRVNPLTLSASFVVSNTPIDDLPDGSRAKQVNQIKLNVPPGTYDRAVVSQFSDQIFFDGDYVAGTYAQLRDLHDLHQLMRVSTPIKNYDNMVITKLSMPRDKDYSGAAGKFDIEWEQITIVSSDIVSSAVVPQAKPTVNKGQVDTQQTDSGDQASLLYNLAHGNSDGLPSFLSSALNLVQ